MTQQFTKEDYQAQLDYFNTPSAMRDDSAHGPYDERVIRFALQLAIEHMKRGQWQPIETAPKDGTTIIIFDSYSDDKSIDGYGVCTARWDYSLKWWIMHQRYSNVISLINPTHWMPLPQPPQERKD
jgi:hypothetical protein